MSVSWSNSKAKDNDGDELEVVHLKLVDESEEGSEGAENASEGEELVANSGEAWFPPLLSRTRMLFLNVTWFGMQFMFLLLSVEVVPSQIQHLVGDKAKGHTLGIIVAMSSVLTFFASPLVGMLSDRIQTKYGKRRPVMVFGTALMSIGFVGMVVIARNMKYESKGCKSLVHLGNGSDYCSHVEKPVCANNTNSSATESADHVQDVVLYSLFFLIGTGSYAILNVAYNGLMADMTHPSVRGFGSGLMGTMIVLGMMSGAGVGVFYKTIGAAWTFSIMYAVLVVTVTITVITIKERPSKAKVHDPVGWKVVLLSYCEPLKDYNFRWVFITRFLMQMGVSTVLGFLQYWLADMVDLPNCMCAESAVSMAMLPLLIGAALCSASSGYLSDRLQRRKPFVFGAALIMSVSATIIAFVPKYYVAIAVALLFGISYGLYVSVDFALVMDVLPDDKDRAKDLAVWHQALVLPQLLATPVAGFVLDYVQDASLPGHSGKLGCAIGLGYIVVFLITALYFLLSSLFVLKIRKVL
ncbi:uncharacterized protein LOC134194396 [Corticium candelabrum]|uniref:uncharacterized protein LOC134194396 n=1 Tax=Corticium candelabrum TaxID=121492 RepID=UPI002E268799|nr:uncharacterized protein LOC134194396 [Corticium candelabrum]